MEAGLAPKGLLSSPKRIDFAVMRGWLVVRTQHQREAWACENIVRQGAMYYLPRIIESKKHGKRSLDEGRVRCLFPGYVFAKSDGRWRFLLGTFGVSYVLMQGQQPAVMPDAEVERLRALEDRDGFVILPTAPPERFRRGSKVKIIGGLFSGFEGIYDGYGPRACEKVLLDYLGRKTMVLIGQENLVPVVA